MGRKSTIEKYLGTTVGGIKILEKKEIVEGRLNVSCKCLACNRIFIAQFHNVYKGGYKSCGCKQHACGIKNPKWMGLGEISKSFWSAIESGAKKRNLIFDISIKDAWNLFLKQNRKCAISGIEIRFQKNRLDTSATASLDRINSNIGYISSNIQWVHKDINYMKQDFTMEEFLFYCETIIKNNENDNDFRRNRYGWKPHG